jgi:transcription antitermination factor NusG
MSNEENEEVKDIIAQLQRLQIKQDSLIARLGRLSQSAEHTGTPPDTAREFVVGDWVRIKNPGVFQPAKGRIVKIGISRVTVQARNGTKVVRDPKNLTHENE